MSYRIFAAILAIFLVITQGVAAQQRERQPSRDSMPSGMMGKRMQQQMDSMNARLDTLVGRMNRASGNAKVSAMAQVINELVAQRRAMQSHMWKMMENHGRMMGGGMMMGDSASTPKRPAPAGQTPPADTSGHAEHHPEKP